MDRYLPIAEHGVIGDLHTIALVGTNGTIDWFCTPHFDSPSVFASILDADEGGSFQLRPDELAWTPKQLYFPDTNVLITRFLTEEGVGEVIDFMPIGGTSDAHHTHSLVRRVLCVRGEMSFEALVDPRFDYGRAESHLQVSEEAGLVFRSADLCLSLSTRAPLDIVGHAAHSKFTLREGERVTFVLERVGRDEPPRAYADEQTERLFAETIGFWRSWVSRSNYRGRWREVVHRSALTLKLLTFAPTGAMVAAPTTSLPETVGGARNWDYRYTWIRDAAFTLYALLRLGFTEESAAFMRWLTDRFRGDARSVSGPLQVLYGIDGRTDLEETVLDHLEGHRGSRPVRVGNAATGQLQLDIYGELIDSVYLYNKYGAPISHAAWEQLSHIVDWVCENWDQPDEGIWEVRGGRKRFTYSRVMCWVAVERAIRVANKRGLPADLARWTAARDEIYRQVMEHGWCEERGAFVQHYDTKVVDASLLLMPLVKFVSPIDPRWLSTLDVISNELVADSLVYRYNAEVSPDGLEGQEGTFSICSFWYVEALARAGRVDEARLVFEKILTHANHLGLYSEEVGATGEQLGNFPQAFTHLALISAAVNLDRMLG